MARWTSNNIPDQAGRVALVTGANTGIGYETARLLAQKRARVVLACRDRARGDDAAARIRAENPGAEVEVGTVDLADLDSVATFAASFPHRQVDVLVANAGVMVPPAMKTKQGFELQIGVNHFGHFALVGRLLQRLLGAPGSRVVVVSSGMHQFGKMVFDDLDFERRGYRAWPAYNQSKLANLLFVLGLQRRLTAAGASTLAVAAHPGTTTSELQRHGTVVRYITPFVAMSAEQGCLPSLRAATDPEVRGGEYYGPGGPGEIWGYPVKVGRTRAAASVEDAERLWAISETRTGVVYPFA